jgi:hypothetical protein
VYACIYSSLPLPSWHRFFCPFPRRRRVSCSLCKTQNAKRSVAQLTKSEETRKAQVLEMHYVILALPPPPPPPPPLLLLRHCHVLPVASSCSVVAVLHPFVFVFVFVDLLFSSRAPHSHPTMLLRHLSTNGTQDTHAAAFKPPSPKFAIRR